MRAKMSNNLGRLKRLKINGYRSIKALDIELKPLNILIGANGAGKSNFIGFFKFMKKILDKDLQFYVAEQGGANRILHFGRKTTDELSFELHFLANSYVCSLSPDLQDGLIFKKELMLMHGMNLIPPEPIVLASPGDKESKFTDLLGFGIERMFFEYTKNWKVYHFHDTGVRAKVKQTCRVDDSAILSSDGANLAALLVGIREHNKNSYNKIVKTIQRAAPFFHDFILEPEKNAPNFIKLKWKHKGTDEYFDANDLSDGTLRFICLTALLLQPSLPSIIILDEPELGLHPFALNILAGMLKSVSLKTQIIASTQSVTFADNFDIGDIVVVDRKENQSVFARLDKEKYKEWLEEFSVGEVWQKNLIGGVVTYD